MSTHQYRDKNLRSCEVVFQREGYDVETLYWSGSMEEVRELANQIAFRGGADTYRIVEFSGSGAGNDHLGAPASDACGERVIRTQAASGSSLSR
jgi:hypothetical protein